MQITYSKIRKRIHRIFHPVQGEIWCLHRVVDSRSTSPSNRDLEITPDYLKSLIAKALAQGHCFVSIDTLLENKSTFSPKRQVSISFDDGFEDVYTNAFPILRKYHIPFILYLSPALISGETSPWWLQLEKQISTPDDYERELKKLFEARDDMQTHYDRDFPHYEIDEMLTWPQIKEMLDSGLCTLGTHGNHHYSLARINPDLAQKELVESKKQLESRFGISVHNMSYPNSEQNATIQRLVKDAGYKSACIGFGGPIRKGDNPYCLNRQYIVQP